MLKHYALMATLLLAPAFLSLTACGGPDEPQLNDENAAAEIKAAQEEEKKMQEELEKNASQP